MQKIGPYDPYGWYDESLNRHIFMSYHELLQFIRNKEVEFLLKARF